MFGRSAPPSGSVNPERIEAAMVEYVDFVHSTSYTMSLTDVHGLLCRLDMVTDTFNRIVSYASRILSSALSIARDLVRLTDTASHLHSCFNT